MIIVKGNRHSHSTTSLSGHKAGGKLGEISVSVKIPFYNIIHHYSNNGRGVIMI